MNTKFLGIEVVGFGDFNVHQMIRLTDLVEYLMGNFPIDRENIIRHSDCTQERGTTKQRILRNGLRKTKKKDIGVNFFGCNDNFKAWREQLKPKTESSFKS